MHFSWKEVPLFKLISKLNFRVNIYYFLRAQEVWKSRCQVLMEMHYLFRKSSFSWNSLLAFHQTLFIYICYKILCSLPFVKSCRYTSTYLLSVGLYFVPRYASTFPALDFCLMTLRFLGKLYVLKQTLTRLVAAVTLPAAPNFFYLKKKVQGTIIFF